MANLVNVVIPPLAQAFTYDLPPDLSSDVEVGFKVEVPLGKRTASGFVVSCLGPQSKHAEQEHAFEIKPIQSEVAPTRCFHANQLEFFQWISDYYGSSLANVIDAAIPISVPKKFQRFITCKSSPDELRGRLQKEIVEYINQAAGPVDARMITKRWKGAGPALRRMHEKGLIEIDEQELIDHHVISEQVPEWAKRGVTLSERQTEAVDYVVREASQGNYAPAVLYGITGSGKTEVYIEAIREVQELGKGSLVIVPEIALTPQLIDRFRARLGNEIAILHSGLSRRARWDSWQALLTGRNKIAIGARSGIFAPIENLGLIIVDEEHDGSYKQSEGLRYNARDLALVRAKMAGCPVMLGSATPSLETYYNAAKGRFKLLALPTRHGTAEKTKIELVDLNQVKPWNMPSRTISPQLNMALEQVIERKEQAFILYNRRGFASYLQCEKCEAVYDCPNCSVTLTYHQHNNSLVCHYCNLHAVPPEYCTKCAQTDAAGDKLKPGKLTQRGSGTEKVFDELQELYPNERIDRLDRDTANNIQSYRNILDRVRSGETRILVGTQMIAKGHDLPNVTLVGVVDCDVGLHMPDFRAGERVFQLLTQASGRAGRAEKSGLVILQTRVPRHLSLLKTVSHDYNGFAKQELISRSALNYPPFTRILRIVCSSQNKALAGEVLAQMRRAIEPLCSAPGSDLIVLGPAPAPIEKLKTQWRWHLLLKSKRATRLNTAMRLLRNALNAPRTVKVIFDLDPQDML